MTRYFGLFMAIAALSLACMVSCGKVFFGSSGSAPAPPAMNDWQYQAQPWPYEPTVYAPYRSASRPRLNDAQAAVYRQLSRDLSDALAAYRQVGVAGYSTVWPRLERERIKLLSLKYDRANQLLSWGYENVGDFDIDGNVNSTDLIPIALYAEAPFTSSSEDAALRSWLDSDGDSQIGRYNAQQIAMSYGRAVLGYNVLAGPDPDPAGMEPIGLVFSTDRLPGWPPHFELHVPAGYNYICIQPLNPKHQVICSYIAFLAAKLDKVSVLYPGQSAR